MKNNKYSLINIDNGRALVIPKTWERPEIYLNDIVNEIKHESNKELYFDLILKNGINDRFYKASFINGSIFLDTFKKTTLDIDIVRISNNFFKNNLGLIETSLMSKFQKYRFKRELELI